MRSLHLRRGRLNPLLLLAVVSVVALAGLASLLLLGDGRNKPPAATGGAATSDSQTAELFMFCAAGLRKPIEQIAADYEREYGVRVQLQYGGSNTLLSQIEVGKTGDIYLAADESYTELARAKGLVQEELPVAVMRPVIAVAKGNPKNIQGIDDLLRDGVRVALGNPDQAAVGKATRAALTETGDWERVEAHVRENGVFSPTVPEVATAVSVGSVAAGVVWDATVAQYPELEAVRTPELDRATSDITISVMTTAKSPTAALKFARYASARDRGLKVFAEFGFDVVDGDVWEEAPQLTFFAGSVNRRALEPIIAQFEHREGVRINTVYNGCGILTAQMRTLEESQAGGFPDMYMACDVYYLETVADMFQDAVNVSNTDIVIVVQKGNPKQIKNLADLAQPGVRVALGQPDQCTIGVLSRRLLESENLYDKLLAENVVTQTATSALLVPSITTGSADAVLAYATDTRAERDKLDVVPIDSPLAKAVQPYSIAKSSDYKHLGRRLFQTIAQSRDKFEDAGFVWRLDADEAAAAEPDAAVESSAEVRGAQ